EINRLFRDGGAVKMSRSLKELSLKAARARDELSKNGSEPTIGEIAQHLGVSPEDAAEAVAAGMPPVSLTAAEDGGEYDLPDDSRESSLIDKLALRQCLDELPEDDRRLIILRYFREMTQSQTAQTLGMTQVQVSRRERKILDGLRALLI
ncbi:MAG: sigma-70 family RNA polymerase sigma factor, partial [Ruminococcus sp.]|nr:sigma-70 family RNA polymerase sigma factor [Ruminococcus sp.]